MNKTRYIQELLLLILAVVLLVLLLNPFSFYMPTPLVMLILGLITALFAAFCDFIFRERGRDEREELHTNIAGRVAFLAAGAIALLGLFFQALSGSIDPWLIGVVAAMVVGKVASLMYVQMRG
jgi:hypothetical protein